MGGDGDETVAVKILSRDKIDGDDCGDLGGVSGWGLGCKDWVDQGLPGTLEILELGMIG